MPQAQYQDYQAGAPHAALFACEITIQKRPDQPFGGQDALYSTKKAARGAAAREAVHWLRQNGHMSETGQPRKKKARLSSNGVSGVSGSSEESGTAKPKAPSFAQQVNGELSLLILISHHSLDKGRNTHTHFLPFEFRYVPNPQPLRPRIPAPPVIPGHAKHLLRRRILHPEH